MDTERQQAAEWLANHQRELRRMQEANPENAAEIAVLFGNPEQRKAEHDWLMRLHQPRRRSSMKWGSTPSVGGVPFISSRPCPSPVVRSTSTAAVASRRHPRRGSSGHPTSPTRDGSRSRSRTARDLFSEPGSTVSRCTAPDLWQSTLTVLRSVPTLALDDESESRRWHSKQEGRPVGANPRSRPDSRRYGDPEKTDFA